MPTALTWNASEPSLRNRTLALSHPLFLAQVPRCWSCTAFCAAAVLRPGLEKPTHRYITPFRQVLSSSLLQYCRTCDMKYHCLELSGVISVLWKEDIDIYQSMGAKTLLLKNVWVSNWKHTQKTAAFLPSYCYKLIPTSLCSPSFS